MFVRLLTKDKSQQLLFCQYIVNICYNMSASLEEYTMAMTNRHNQKRDSFIIYTLNDLVPQDHLVRKWDVVIAFNFIYDKVKHLYSLIGRPSIGFVVLFKLL